MSVVPFYKAAATLIARSGLAVACAPFTGGMGMIFTLHRVQPEKGTGFRPNMHLEVTPDFLDRVLARVRDRGFEIVTLMEAVRRVRAGGSDKPFCVFTLDDGYRDNIVHALPVFRRHSAPMTVFVCTDLIDGKPVLWWEILQAVLERTEDVEFDLGAGNRRIRVDTPERKCSAAKTIAGQLLALPTEQQARAGIKALAEKYGVDGTALCRQAGATWDALRKAVRDPLFHVGAHTVSHPTLSRLTPDEVRSEVLQGRERLQSELGIYVEHFAYPYGYRSACGQREFDLLAEMGFKSAVTTRPGVLVPAHAQTLTALPRVSLNGHYQTIAMVDSLLSGVPFFIGNGFRRAPALN